MKVPKPTDADRERFNSLVPVELIDRGNFL